MRNKILSRLYVLSVLGTLFWSCSSEPEYKYNFQLYPLMDCLMHNGWVGLGDSTAEYTQDSILFRGLKVEGKSFVEYAKYMETHQATHAMKLTSGLRFLIFLKFIRLLIIRIICALSGQRGISLMKIVMTSR